MANGILGVMRTSTAEIVKERKYLARAFLALPLVFNLGRVAALVIGDYPLSLDLLHTRLRNPSCAECKRSPFFF